MENRGAMMAAAFVAYLSVMTVVDFARNGTGADKEVSSFAEDCIFSWLFLAYPPCPFSSR